MNNLEPFRNIKAFAFDLDGVFTDHSLFVFENGKIVRRLNQKDLFAVKIARQQHYPMAIISGGRLEGLKPVFQSLGIDCYENSQDKKEDYDEFKLIHNLDDENILFMGDDLPDYSIMRVAGLAACPQNAAPEILEITRFQSAYKGGEGCVREMIEKVLRIQKTWPLK